MELVPPSSKSDWLPWIGSHALAASLGISLRSPWKHSPKVNLEWTRICTTLIFDCLAWNNCATCSLSQIRPYLIASRANRQRDEDSSLSCLLWSGPLPLKYVPHISTLPILLLLAYIVVCLCRRAHLARQTPWIFLPRCPPKLLNTPNSSKLLQNFSVYSATLIGPT